MTNRMLWVGVVAMMSGCAAYAQDLAGDWRGTLKTGPVELRLVLHVAKADGGFSATMDSIDQGAHAIPVDKVTLNGADLKLAVETVHGTYEGKVSADGAAIKGTWTQGQPMVLDFERGTFKLPEHKPAKPSDIDGAWSGVIDAQGKILRLVFHIVNTEDGLTATIDVPDQGAKGLPVTTITRNGTSLKFEMKGFAATFDGKIAADLDNINGTFSQMGTDIPLVLARIKAGAQ